MRKGTTIILILLLAVSTSVAWASPGLNKSQLKAFNEANIRMDIGDYRTALNTYLELYKSDTTHPELNLRIGICYFGLKEFSSALPYLEWSQRQGEVESYYYLGQVYHYEGEIDREIALYQMYKNTIKSDGEKLTELNRLLDQAKYAKELTRVPVNVSIENVGAPINTPYHEYVPLIYGGQDEMYFTSRRPGSTGGVLDPYGIPFEDVYRSTKAYGQWGSPERLGPNINTATHDACVGISSDGQILYIFRTNEDLISGDLYECELGQKGWELPKRLGSDINSDAVESSATISPDGRTLYFSSDREGGYGGKDLYRAKWMPNGEWSLVQNLGPTINTPYDEDVPFIHSDGVTLYFSSKGHRNMGGYDIFSSEMREEGLWTEPENLGFPINSTSDDACFVMAADKQTGYYSSAQKGGYGGHDIYMVNFKLEAKILSVVKGGILARDTNSIPLQAKITLINSTTKAVQGIYKSREADGRFIMLITPESTYTMVVEAEGYHTMSREISFVEGSPFEQSMESLKLTPLDEKKDE